MQNVKEESNKDIEILQKIKLKFWKWKFSNYCQIKNQVKSLSNRLNQIKDKISRSTNARGKTLGHFKRPNLQIWT
jgi:hypothetical protein